jgi:hypothetical protein
VLKKGGKKIGSHKTIHHTLRKVQYGKKQIAFVSDKPTDPNF